MNATTENLSAFNIPYVPDAVEKQSSDAASLLSKVSVRDGWNGISLEKHPEDEPNEGWDDVNADTTDTKIMAEIGGISLLQDTVRCIVVVDDMNRSVLMPRADSYPGESPYGAPLTGSLGKIAELFDAFAYLPNGQNAQERPLNFMPVVGLMGDDKIKNEDPKWRLFGRLRTDVYEKVKLELGDINTQEAKPVVLVTQMRADNFALFSISQPHKMFSPTLWLAALPLSVMKVPMKTLPEPHIRTIVLAERAKAEIHDLCTAGLTNNKVGQMSLCF